MASFITKVTHSAAMVPHRSSNFTNYLVDKGERYAGAAAFGFVKNYYREKAMVKGIPADLLAGGLLTLGAVAMEMFSHGRSKAACHLNAIGDAGVMSFFNSMGAAYGTKMSGRKVYVLAPGAAAPAALPPGMTAVGAIPQAVGGAYLTAEEIARHAGSR